MDYQKEYLKEKAKELWNTYQCFKDDLNILRKKAESAGIKTGYKLDFTDTFIDMNERLGMALEELFDISCFDDEE